MHTTKLSFSVDTGDLNSGPLASTVGTLPDELFPEAPTLTSQEEIDRDKAIARFGFCCWYCCSCCFSSYLKIPLPSFILLDPVNLQTKY